MARQQVRGCGGFAQIVAQAGVAHGQRGLQLGGHVEHEQQVLAGVDFGVVFGALGYAEEGIDFGQHMRQRAAGA